MGTIYPEIDAKLRTWIGQQPMFFVGTAPCGEGGHVNISPKGDMRTFRVLDERTLAYVDLFGSGIETVAHLKENGRIVVMMCAFTGRPRVVRFHGRGRVVEKHDPEFAVLIGEFPVDDRIRDAMRAMIVIDVRRISDSCGFTVPLMELRGDRETLYQTATAWIARDGEQAIEDYCDLNNDESIDGLTGLMPFSTDPTHTSTAHSANGRPL